MTSSPTGDAVSLCSPGESAITSCAVFGGYDEVRQTGPGPVSVLVQAMEDETHS